MKYSRMMSNLLLWERAKPAFLRRAFVSGNDSSNATATATITVTVTAVNDQPSTTVNPIAFERDAQTGAYVETTATFTVNPGAENETDQTFEIVDMVVTDEGGILNGNPTMSFDGTTLTVVAKPVAEPDPSAKAFVKFKIKEKLSDKWLAGWKLQADEADE